MLKGGKEISATFPNAQQRTTVALLMADADARTRRTQDEFAIYDAVLHELAIKADQMPLGLRASGTDEYSRGAALQNVEEDSNDAGQGMANNSRMQQALRNAAFQVSAAAEGRAGRRSPEYARVLERYLARLVELKQFLRRSACSGGIDHCPNDPGLYERLATFLTGPARNGAIPPSDRTLPRSLLVSQTRAVLPAPAQERSWRNFPWTPAKFSRDQNSKASSSPVISGTPQLYLRLNQYANARFPHNPVFVHNLSPLTAIPPRPGTRRQRALLRQHWFEETDLRDQFFEFLQLGRASALN